MNWGKFFKLVVLFTIIFGLILGAFVFGYRFISGDSSVLKGLGSLFDVFEKGRVNGLVLGLDESGKRTDFIMFVSYNKGTKKINMISIPRDTRVPNSPDKKINSLYQKGKEDLVIKDAEDILDVSIDYYAVVDFKGLRKIVDDIGGISMDVPTDMYYYDPYQKLEINIQKGHQILDGKKAEGFVRFRSGYPDADLGRIKAQQKFVEAAITQVLKTQNITKLPSIIKTVYENVKTNMPISEMLGYIDDAAKMSSDKIVAESLPGQPKYIAGGSYFIYDKDKTKQMIDRILYDDEELSDKEAVERNKAFKVEVFNGTDVPGLGTRVSDKLKEKGFSVIRIENYDSNVETTKIYERTRKVEGSFVRNAIKVGEVYADYIESDVDITVIVGQDANN